MGKDHDDIQVSQLAWAELSTMRLLDVLPSRWEGARLAARATPVYDVNGEELYLRFPFTSGAAGDCEPADAGYADVASNPALGEALLAVSQDATWNEDEVREQALAAARERLEERDVWDLEMRFVAYSYPKLAAQFLRAGEEVAMLELFTWEPVPPLAERRYEEPPSHFERWSLLDEMPKKQQRENIRTYEKRAADISEKLGDFKIGTPIHAEALYPFVDLKPIPLVDTRELHYSTRNSDHHTCYEVRGQETNVWCVGASVQMLLDFYRYEYSQVRLAQELGLGTLSNPNGLPYSRVNDVVTVIEKMTANALDATIDSSPTFAEFRNEIRANRPLISFVPGHSRTIAGYTQALISIWPTPPFRGLLVYDPWPPNSGVITRWENYATQIYQFLYTAKVTKV